MLQILEGHVLTKLKSLPAESVHCAVTSPPYYGLRDYGIEPQVWGGDVDCVHEWGDSIKVNATNHTDKRRWNHTRNGRDESQPPEKRVAWRRSLVDQGNICVECGAWRGSLGLEPTIELYIEHIVEVFREVRRVLRSDGTLWLNIGDSYANDTKWGGSSGGKHAKGLHGQTGIGRAKVTTGLKPKDRMMMPARVALALQADGWWLRDEIVWHKPAPMPSSVTDRTTPAHEMIYLLTKRARYFYDQEAIKEPCSESTHARISQDLANQVGSYRANGGGKTNGPMKAVIAGSTRKMAQAGSGVANNDSYEAALAMRVTTRNKRSVWSINSEPFPDAHFATFPTEIPRVAILAGTSARGCCVECGAPWERVLKPSEAYAENLGKDWAAYDQDNFEGRGKLVRNNNAPVKRGPSMSADYETVGWQPTCKCAGEATAPCVVLDPFAGSGTTAKVAIELARKAIAIELSADYVRLIQKRTTTTIGLPLAI